MFVELRVVVVGEKLYSHLFEIVKITQGLGYSSLFFKSLSKANIASNDIIVIDCSITPELSTDISNFVISVATIPNYKKCFSNETVVSISNLKEIEQAIKTNFVDGFNVPIIVDESSVKLFEIADKVAQTDATILISGETGTGKEVLAKYIHKKSARSNNNFVAINCAAIPENLLESELFGHEKGAFTNAYQKRIGKFEEAHHGTILLDEISEMPLLLQAKLLRVIQEKEFCRLGSNEKIKVDVRIIATSNKNLEKAVEAGTFREDLFYRLNIIPLEILPLRNRRADIIPLAVFFCKKYSNSHKQMTKELLDQLSLLKWKGNVRELENFVQRAIILSSKDAIDLEDVILKKSESTDCEIKTLDQIEKNAILEALKKFDGNKAIVSEKLGISARTLRYKLHTYKNQKTDSNLVA